MMQNFGAILDTGGLGGNGNGRHRFAFQVDIRPIDNGFLVRVSDKTGTTEHAFFPSRATKMADFISQRLLMALEAESESA